MGAFSNYSEEKWVEHNLRNNAVASPVAVYLALFTGDPKEAGDGPEATYTNYERKVSTWTSLDTNGQTKNAGQITFPPNGNAVNDETITHAAVFDAATGGNCLLKGPLASQKTLQPGDVLAFAPNALALTLD